MEYDVIDLFAGMGGFSIGFSREKYRVLGVDIDEKAVQSYRRNELGEAIRGDIRELRGDKYRSRIVVGGPPCRPFSTINTRTRGEKHSDYDLVGHFFRFIREMHGRWGYPEVFVMENVIALRRFPILRESIERVRKSYMCITETMSYLQFGAPTKRERLFVFCVERSVPDVGPRDLIEEVVDIGRREKRRTVRDAIWDLRNVEKGGFHDHVWPNLKTIKNYRDKYLKNRYGWFYLEWDKPSRSFGNAYKTYILHPDSVKYLFNGKTGPMRIISIREAMRIMGFGDERINDDTMRKLSYYFPDLPMGSRYQMVADTVSPFFSLALARAIRKLF